MTWFLIGFLLGSPLTDHFGSREACEGRAVVLREKGFDGRCVPLVDPSKPAISYSGGFVDTPGISQITPYLSPR